MSHRLDVQSDENVLLFNPCKYKTKLSVLPEGGHKVHHGPAHDKGSPGADVGIPHFVHTVSSPHGVQWYFIFYLKNFLYLERYPNKTSVSLFHICYGSSCAHKRPVLTAPGQSMPPSALLPSVHSTANGDPGLYKVCAEQSLA